MEHYTLPRLLLFAVACLLAASSASACDRCVHQSKAAYFSSSSAMSSGACSYGPLALQLNAGYVAAGASKLFRDGVGCGACYQIRCIGSPLCSTAGVKVVLTDHNHSNQTDFVLAPQGFAAMAKRGAAPGLIKLGVVDVEYKRIPCEYRNKNFSLRVEEHSKKPNYLTVKFLYQGGQTDIVAADVATVNASNWRFLSRDHGPVWTTSMLPQGPLQLRLVVTGGYDGKWVWADRQVLPADWKNGVVYDAGVKIADIAQEACLPCDNFTWK